MSTVVGSQAFYDVVVVGGGAAGVGVGVALQDAGIENFVILERFIVGGSFLMWPSETRFITPSFPTNSVGMLDLNAIAMGTSPAFNLEVEHPTGEQYAVYLNAVARYYSLPVREHVDVKAVSREGDLFRLQLGEEEIHTKNLIWAGGEFQYPRTDSFDGCRYCLHTSKIPSYEDLDGDEFLVVGGYESGVDAAYHLARRGKRVRMLDRGTPWNSGSSDPSVALSVYSMERMREPHFKELVTLVPDAAVKAVERAGDAFDVVTEDGRRFTTSTVPLWAGGFVGGHTRIASLFERRDDGLPFLTENDESTITPGLYLSGPSVRHGNHIFCFIFKYRQRFAVVAKAIATSFGLEAKGLEPYRWWSMFLDDLSCCGEECVC